MELAASESNIERQGSTLEYTYTRRVSLCWRE
jgi:hypothetical protein